jgi:hypothetical protein
MRQNEVKLPVRECRGCGRNTPHCTECTHCTKCNCECFVCEVCHRRCRRTTPNFIKHFCTRCKSVCKRCCECRKAPKFMTDAALRVMEVGYPGGKSLITRLPRTLGVELEIADWRTLSHGATTSIPHLRWISTHDWSVKPSETEMVVSPMRGDAFVRGMVSLSHAATQHGLVFNETCALHVHVGGKDLSYWEIRRLLEVYLRVEGEVYNHLIAPHRRTLPSIHYCQMMINPHHPVGCERCERYDRQYPGQRYIPESLSTTLSRMRLARSTQDLKICLIRMLYGVENPQLQPDTLAARKGGHYEFCRYFGLNLHSWLHRMTVEWRMKEATADPMELVMWPLWCGWFVHAITRMTDADARSDKMCVRYLTERYMPGYLVEYISSKGL